MDITDLEQGYAGLIAEARLGGFSAPAPGEWTAEQIIAHVAANDELIFKATSQVLAGQPHPYYNHDAINTEELTKMIGTKGGLPELLEWLSHTSSQLCALAKQLPDDDATLVHTTIQDGQTVRLDRPVPWTAVLNTQARVHLPAHLDQLRGLR